MKLIDDWTYHDEHSNRPNSSFNGTNAKHVIEQRFAIKRNSFVYIFDPFLLEYGLRFERFERQAMSNRR